ncbi:MAG: ABC transporter substrate-binding protein [Janthinobacterium lividum]
MFKKALLCATVAALCASAAYAAPTEKHYSPGATDSEIRIGQTTPYSGPASAYTVYGVVQLAYYKMLNEEHGGINGRKVTLLSLDDAYSPPKTFEQTRNLIEHEQVLAIIGSLGTPTGVAVRGYLNQKKVPQLLQLSNSSQWNKPKQFPWSMSLNLAADQEASALAKWLLSTKPDAKIGIVYENDDFGKDYVAGFQKGLGDKASMIVKTAGFELTDSNPDSQVLELKAAGANVVVVAAANKFAALSIRKMADMQWEPLKILATGGNAIGSVLKVAGLQNAIGAVSVSVYKDPLDPATLQDKDVRDFYAFMKKYCPTINAQDTNSVGAYVLAEVAAWILQHSGNDLTRENVMRSATHLDIKGLPMVAQGVTISNSPENYLAFHELQLMRFDGTTWRSFARVPAPPTPAH